MRAIEIVREKWGQLLPDWLQALAEACDATSQRKVAKLLGYSATTINQVINNGYGSGLREIEATVRAKLLTQDVECPVLGTISSDRCLDEQRRPFAATSGLRVRLWRTCKVCQRNVSKEAAS